MKKHTDYVIDREGNAVAGAEVYVRKQSDDTLASLFSDDGSTAISNPVTTDSDGEFAFYVTDGTYKLQVYVGGVQQQEVNNFQHFDLDSITTFGFSLIDDADAATARTTLGLGDVATLDIDTDDTLAADSDSLIPTQQAVKAYADAAAAGAVSFASASEIRTGTEAAKAISPDGMFDAAALVTLTSSSNATAVDMNSGINFTLTLGEDSTISNPTNAKVGQSGVLYIIQDGTGGWTPTFAANWKAVGAVAAVETASVVNVFSYFVRATDAITLCYLGVES